MFRCNRQFSSSGLYGKSSGSKVLAEVCEFTRTASQNYRTSVVFAKSFCRNGMVYFGRGFCRDGVRTQDELCMNGTVQGSSQV